MKIKTLAIAMMVLFAQIPSGFADYNSAMWKVDQDFDMSNDKIGFITQRIETSWAWYGQSNDRYRISPSGNKIIGLVIREQDLPRAKKFLDVIEDPNDPSLLDDHKDGCLNMVHLAAFVNGTNADFRKPIALLDLLKEKKFDFNFSDDSRVAPPLVHSKIKADDENFVFSQEIRARLLIHGADPQVEGITEDDLSDLLMRAYCQIVEEGWELKNIKATDYVKELIAEKHKALSKKFSL